MENVDFKQNIEKLVMDHINILNSFEGGTAREYNDMEQEEQKVLFSKIEKQRMISLSGINGDGRAVPQQNLTNIIGEILLAHDIRRVV